MEMGIVDGYEGKIIIDPPVSVMEAYQKKKAEDEEKEASAAGAQRQRKHHKGWNKN